MPCTGAGIPLRSIPVGDGHVEQITVNSTLMKVTILTASRQDGHVYTSCRYSTISSRLRKTGVFNVIDLDQRSRIWLCSNRKMERHEKGHGSVEVYDGMQKLESKPGNYCILIRSHKRQRTQIGRWGYLNIEPGYYLYVGSAFGPGGVSARVLWHCRKSPIGKTRSGFTTSDHGCGQGAGRIEKRSNLNRL